MAALRRKNHQKINVSPVANLAAFYR
jgi:hypothetical protein